MNISRDPQQQSSRRSTGRWRSWVFLALILALAWLVVDRYQLHLV